MKTKAVEQQPGAVLIETTRKLMNLRDYFIMVVMGEIAMAVVISVITSKLLAGTAIYRVLAPEVIIVVLFILAGALITVMFSRWFLSPVVDLSDAIESVADGDFSASVSTDSRVREIRKLYKSFDRMTARLRETEILQSDFVSNVSHEFKTPISAIQGYVTLLSDESQSEEEKAHCMDRILFNTDRLSKLVGNVLLLSKINDQQASFKKSSFRLDEQIRMAIVGLEPRWQAKGIEFDVDMDEAGGEGCGFFLILFWTNLVDNAIKFSPEGGTVAISLKKSRKGLTVTVSDSGPGIDPEKRDHIFDRFYQGDSSHRSEGNGLGLALAKRIVDLSGGSIGAENSKSGGAVFRVAL